MPTKVFELAKELEIKPLDLVETLKAEGYNVRNHMNSLTDEEVEAFLAKRAEAEEAKAAKAKKKTKKKTTKKKVAKKKVAKKTAKKTTVVTVADPDVAEAKAKAKTAKKTTKKAKVATTTKEPAKTTVVIRRKASPKKSDLDSDSAATSKKKKSETQDEEVAASAETREMTTDPKTGEKVFKEKMHSFTPVSKPEEAKGTSGGAPEKPKPTLADAQVEEAAGKDSKKRIGDLAAMMSKPKTTAKSRDLVQMRADEELKNYIAAGMGKQVYTPPKKKKIYSGPSKKTRITEVKNAKRYVEIYGSCTAKELAQKLNTKFETVANDVLKMNLLLDEEDHLGVQLAEEIASLYNFRVENKDFDEDEAFKSANEKDATKYPSRNPIITVMGHVDHGKTTLVDHIRQSQIVTGEAGGITQHIGAYSVKASKGILTFLDTPGHAAFGAMRERGTQVTDVVILVVAADDGVMPQTRESVLFCKNNNVPIIVAVNKMDKEGANPDRVKQGLTELNITPEEWGGETQFVEISALKGEGIDDLLEAVSLQAEMMDLRANEKGPAEGIVIESKIEVGRGPTATVLIQSGTLKKGDTIVVGETFGRARSLIDSSGAQLKSAGPSTPVQILGLNEAPAPGDSLNIAKNEREAKKVVTNRVDKRKELEGTNAIAMKKVSLEDFFASAQGDDAGKKVLKVIIRTDVQGSFEAIKSSLETLGNSEVGVQVIGGGVGAISDSDVNLAASAEGIIFGFNMRPITSARRLAEQEGVDVKTYSIIYELINDVTLALEGMLEPEFTEKFIGRAEVKDTFNIPKIGVIAGSSVIDGKIEKGCNIRLLRDGKIVFDGSLSSLKRFKDDVKEVKQGLECGISLDGFNDVKVNDIFEAYIKEEKKRKLESESTMRL